MFNPYSWTSCLFSTLNINNSWWIIFFIFLCHNATKKSSPANGNIDLYIHNFLKNNITQTCNIYLNVYHTTLNNVKLHPDK